ncbi:unnamed protein product [Fraxinus pennsylvanica]|uniref:FYVE-type domain-containing protein n=1 Tax=Fraxinus pennsylvanica TaxID=56036 RepID=A0AAD2DRQ3_9LAMI|nr:unnamed protein product [Fraxinus pennsylvanica]
MQHGDYTSIPYYQQQQYPQTHNPNPIDDLTHYPPPPPSYASAPPVSPNNYTPPPPSSADHSTTSYQHNSSSYPHFPQNLDPLPTALSFQKPQPSYSSPQLEVHGQYSTPPSQLPQQQSYYSSYDQPAANYSPSHKPVGPNSQYPSLYTSQFNQSYPPGKRSESGYGGYGKNDWGFGNNEGVYAYKKSSSEPYGARGTAPKSSTLSGFDDFGRPIGHSSPSGKERSTNTGLKVVKAVPKADSQQDTKGGVQKYRVKLLAESAGQSTMDVLCQIGLDGIRMLDPATSRVLRIYPLDTITRCEGFDSSTFAFWSKSSVDIEPKRIRLQSNSYTTNTILDTVTAATVQFKEMGGRIRPSEQPTEKRRGFADWMNRIKPVNEEKDHWVPDEAATKCTGCGTDFNAFVRKHHCRNCGDIFCDKCTQGRTALTADENSPVVRVCDRCLAEVSRRLSTAKDSVSGSTGLLSHEDLAKKLQCGSQNRMDWFCSTVDIFRCFFTGGDGKKPQGIIRLQVRGFWKEMKEVACPTCTVHLQVQVPSSGSETIECGVCQHPFLVSSH